MSIIDTAKDAYDLAKKGMTIELQEELLKMREEALALQEENLELRKKVQQLEQKQDLSEKVKWEKPHYWIEDGDKRDGPYCQKCYDGHKKLVRLQGGRNDLWDCLECKSRIVGPEYTTPEPIIADTDWRI